MPRAITTAWQIFCSIHREVEKKQIFYGQADHKGGPPTHLTLAFRDVLVCAKNMLFGSKFRIYGIYETDNRKISSLYLRKVGC